MKRYDFDTPVNRFGTDCMKWDNLKAFYGREDLTPMWVADMDLPCCDEIVQALTARAQHGIFGYGVKPRAYFEGIIDWYKRHHCAAPQYDWMLYMPNVVTGLRAAVSQLTAPGESVIIMEPVYGPFRKAVEGLGRTVAAVPLLHDEARCTYDLDLAGLESALKNGSKLLLFCSPHNPVGRVWSHNEVEQVARLCLAHGAIMVSDEIHSDLVYEKGSFTPVIALSEELRNNTITFISVSKTFNCAGLMGATAFIPCRELLLKFAKPIVDYNLYMTNVFTIAGVQAAYKYGDEWLAQVLDYIHGNYEFVAGYLGEHLPQVKHAPLQGTYLMWLDCHALAPNDEELERLFQDDALIAGEPGNEYGKPGVGFYRLNLATSRCVLQAALENLAKAVAARAKN